MATKACFLFGKKLNAMGFLWLFSLVWFSNTPTVEAQTQVVQTAGDVLLISLPATALSSTLLVGDYKGTWQFTKGFLLNYALTRGMKLAINKKRPYNNGNLAFPSGHTSITFQSASFIQRRYGWEFGIPAYTLAGFTGFSRINAHKHDAWDVLAGAVIGIGSSYLFTTPYQKEHMQLSFHSGQGEYLFGFTYRF